MKKAIAFAMALMVGFMNIPASNAASLPSATLPDGLGVNIHFTGAPTRDLDLIRDAGFKFVRMDMFWHNVERQRGVYTWTAYDQLMTGLEQRGVRAMFVLAFNNPNVYGGQWMAGLSTTEQRTAYANFAKAAAARYKNRGVIWEIWNEPNLNKFWLPSANVSQYMAMAMAAIPAIRSADPNATIIAPAAAEQPGTGQLAFGFLEECFRGGLLNSIDAVSVHPYRQPGPENVAANIQQLKDLIRRYSPNRDIPIIAGEWGYSTSWSMTGNTQTQANYLERMFLHNIYLGIPLTIWYDFKDDGTNPSSFEHNFGTVKYDYTKKPAYYAMQKLTNALRGKSFIRRLSSASNEYLLEFSDGTNTTVAAWTTGSTHNVTISGQSVSLSQIPRYVSVAGGTTPPPPPPTTTAPNAASSLGITSVTKGATTGNYFINLGWTDNSSNETGFLVQQSINSTTNFQTIATIGANTTTYASNIGATPNPGDYYRYRVIAVNGSAQSQPSNIAMTQMGTPNSPSNLTINQTRNSNGNYIVTLNWSDNSGIETGHKIYQSNNATTGFQEVKTVGAAVTSTTIDLGTNPTAGTYYYQVTAYAAMGESSPTNTVNTQIAAPVVPVPAAPTNMAVDRVTVGATSGQVYVYTSWQDNSSNESGFELYQSVNSTDNFQLIKSPSANTSTYGINLGKNPTPGTYYYKITAVNSYGKSQDSNIANTQIGQAAPPPTQPVPTAPASLTSMVGKDVTGNNAVILNWQDNSNNEDGFNIYVSSSATSGFTKLASLAANQNLVVHILDSLSNNTTLYYLIKAFNSGGESTSTNTTSVNIQ